jgi:hypothetical protein
MVRAPTASNEIGQRQCLLQRDALSSSYGRWCSSIVLLIICCMPVTSTVSAFLFDHTVRLPYYHHGQSFQQYILPNHCFNRKPTSAQLPFIRTNVDTQNGIRIILNAATISALHQKNQVSVLTQRSDDISSNNTGNVLTKYRALTEVTRQLLNGTEIGSWDRTDFEMMENIVESLCSTSSLSQQLQQKHWLRRQQQLHYKRAALTIERFLHRIIQEQRMENPFADCVDMTALYTSLIFAWSFSNEMGSPERAEEILDNFQTIYEEGDSYDPLLCGPTIDSFNAVIGAYAQSDRTDAPQQAIRVLTKLYELKKAGRTMASPNQQSFACMSNTFIIASSALISLSH